MHPVIGKVESSISLFRFLQKEKYSRLNVYIQKVCGTEMYFILFHIFTVLHPKDQEWH